MMQRVAYGKSDKHSSLVVVVLRSVKVTLPASSADQIKNNQADLSQHEIIDRNPTFPLKHVDLKYASRVTVSVSISFRSKIVQNPNRQPDGASLTEQRGKFGMREPNQQLVV